MTVQPYLVSLFAENAETMGFAFEDGTYLPRHAYGPLESLGSRHPKL